MILYTNPNAPSCIREICKYPSEETMKSVKEIAGSEKVVFGAICPCGSEVFTVEIEDGIVYLVCVLCGFRFIIFDPYRHGVSALSHTQKREQSSLYLEYKCSKCGNTGVNINIALRYPPDAELKELSEKLKEKTEDLFVWYTLAVRCSDCGKREVILETDCS